MVETPDAFRRELKVFLHRFFSSSSGTYVRACRRPFVTSSSQHSLAAVELELVSKELNHLAAILHVYAGGLNFMK